MFGIKKLKNKIKELERRTDALSKYFRGIEDKIYPDSPKEHFMNRLLDCKGVTKLEIEANTEIKFQFAKPRIFLIIE